MPLDCVPEPPVGEGKKADRVMAVGLVGPQRGPLVDRGVPHIPAPPLPPVVAEAHQLVERFERSHQWPGPSDNAATPEVGFGNLAFPLGQGQIDQRPHRSASHWRAVNNIGHPHHHRLVGGEHCPTVIDDHPPDGPGHFLGHRLWQAPQVHDVAPIMSRARRAQGEAQRPFLGHLVMAVSGSGGTAREPRPTWRRGSRDRSTLRSVPDGKGWLSATPLRSLRAPPSEPSRPTPAARRLHSHARRSSRWSGCRRDPAGGPRSLGPPTKAGGQITWVWRTNAASNRPGPCPPAGGAAGLPSRHRASIRPQSCGIRSGGWWRSR